MCMFDEKTRDDHHFCHRFYNGNFRSHLPWIEFFRYRDAIQYYGCSMCVKYYIMMNMKLIYLTRNSLHSTCLLSMENQRKCVPRQWIGKSLKRKHILNLSMIFFLLQDAKNESFRFDVYYIFIDTGNQT